MASEVTQEVEPTEGRGEEGRGSRGKGGRRSGKGRGRGRGRGRSGGRGSNKGRGDGNGTPTAAANDEPTPPNNDIKPSSGDQIPNNNGENKADGSTKNLHKGRRKPSNKKLNMNAAPYIPSSIKDDDTAMAGGHNDDTGVGKSQTKNGSNELIRDDHNSKANNSADHGKPKKQPRKRKNARKGKGNATTNEDLTKDTLQGGGDTNDATNVQPDGTGELKADADDSKTPNQTDQHNDKPKRQQRGKHNARKGKGNAEKDDLANKGAGENTTVADSAQTQNSRRNDTRNRKGKGGAIATTTNDTNKVNDKDKRSVNFSFKTAEREEVPTATPNKPKIQPNQPQQTNDINYGKGEHISILHVGEKPSIAEAIANGLARGSRDFRKNILPVHVFTDPEFPHAPKAKKCTHKVTSVAGHVFSVDFPDEYQSWDSVDPAELFQAPIKRKPCKGSIIKHLQDEAKGVDFIVLWMDCDREGENINFEVLECCMHLMKGGGGVAHYDRVYRAYFSAINPTDIVKAYNALGKPDKNQSLAVDARQELDLKVGVAFSRFQTRYFQGRYGDLDSAVLSYGPCQTPTLGFCVQRHIDIETFKPEPYWTIELGVLKRGRSLKALWEGGRSFNKSKTERLVQTALDNSRTVIVSDVVIKDKKQGRPTALNTVALLKASSKALGIGPHATMQAAERLYLSGYLSYPRTESSAYPKSFDIPGTLQEQAGDSRWGSYVRELLSTGHNNGRGGVDMGDHPPITPCRSAYPGELTGDMARIYEFVVRHFIASVSHDAMWRSTLIDFVIESLGEKGKFILSGKEIVSPGFLAVLLHKSYGDDAEDGEVDEEERSIPEFTKGEEIPLLQSNGSSGKVAVVPGAPVWAALAIKEKMTTAPGYLTESELIGKMEKNQIGTDASIPTHIENIMKRNYVTLGNGRRLIPTRLGIVLVQGYHQIDGDLVLPTVRSDIEGQCNQIAKGEMEKDQVVKRAIEIFENKFQFFVKNIERMDVLFGSSFSKLEDVGRAFTRCGLSRRYLQLIAGPPPRLYNRHTETVYPLPAGGNVKQWSGRTCPVEGCNFELCLYSVGAPERSFPLCPNCYNNVDWSMEPSPEDPDDKEDEHKESQIRRVAGKSLTLECPLPNNHPLIDDLMVSRDPDSDGVFILDPHFGPKWRLVSTREATIIYLPKSIEKITVLDEKDDVLGCHLMKITFKDGESPLDDGSTTHTCCFAIDAVLQSASRFFHGSERTKGRGRGGRGRGNRGGRGGRGGRGRR